MRIALTAYQDEEFSDKTTNPMLKRTIRDLLTICGHGVNGVPGRNARNHVGQV